MPDAGYRHPETRNRGASASRVRADQRPSRQAAQPCDGVKMRAVILAGGSGTRLWPLSRERMAKQFLNLLGERSLLQDTVERVRPLVGDKIVVVAGAADAFLVERQLAELGIDPAGRVVGEPVGRNTAPAIGLAALLAPPEEVLLVLPSDHAIGKDDRLREALGSAAAVAEARYLVTFGIRPSAPETGYGYIQLGDPLSGFPGFRSVARFVEKPDEPTARRYLEEATYVWNSGMFAFRAGTLLENLAEHAPEVHAGLQALLPELKRGAPLSEELYAATPKISIDYAVMERAQQVAVLPVDPDWSDLGSFTALHGLLPQDEGGNAVRSGTGGEGIVLDGRRNLVLGGERVVALVGMDDTVVVDTPDAVLVCARERSQDVRRVYDRLKREGREEAEVPRTVHRPWGTYTVLEERPGHKVKRIAVHPRSRLSLQLHRHRSEHWTVVRGTARVTRGDDVLELGVGEHVFIPSEAPHRAENPGPEVLEFVEVQTGTYLGEDDIVRLEDDYGRM